MVTVWHGYELHEIQQSAQIMGAFYYVCPALVAVTASVIVCAAERRNDTHMAAIAQRPAFIIIALEDSEAPKER
ncbi:hypothetical protein [Paenibacillus dauci]|uniref:hypothetical protein n=1 Tax=Paenibacillus dauci TaxID=1567106 RepID=UPI000619581F|nr:hypothetical protein [Paenibacillus dauci]